VKEKKNRTFFLQFSGRFLLRTTLRRQNMSMYRNFRQTATPVNHNREFLSRLPANSGNFLKLLIQSDGPQVGIPCFVWYELRIKFHPNLRQKWHFLLSPLRRRVSVETRLRAAGCRVQTAEVSRFFILSKESSAAVGTRTQALSHSMNVHLRPFPRVKAAGAGT
jgi:hypothetical protein